MICCGGGIAGISVLSLSEVSALTLGFINPPAKRYAIKKLPTNFSDTNWGEV